MHCNIVSISACSRAEAEASEGCADVSAKSPAAACNERNDANAAGGGVMHGTIIFPFRVAAEMRGANRFHILIGKCHAAPTGRSRQPRKISIAGAEQCEMIVSDLRTIQKHARAGLGEKKYPRPGHVDLDEAAEILAPALQIEPADIHQYAMGVELPAFCDEDLATVWPDQCHKFVGIARCDDPV